MTAPDIAPATREEPVVEPSAIGPTILVFFTSPTTIAWFGLVVMTFMTFSLSGSRGQPVGIEHLPVGPTFEVVATIEEKNLYVVSDGQDLRLVYSPEAPPKNFMRQRVPGGTVSTPVDNVGPE